MKQVNMLEAKTDLSLNHFFSVSGNGKYRSF